MIVRRRGKWLLLSRDGGRVLGRHDTREDAVRQEAAIESRKADAAKLKRWADKRR